MFKTTIAAAILLAVGMDSTAHAQFWQAPQINPYASAAMWADAARSRHAAAQNVLATLPNDRCAREVRERFEAGADLDGFAVEDQIN